MWIERVQQASAQFENLNGRLGPCIGPQAVFAYPFSPLNSHSAKRRMERNWGSHHWNASLCAADSLMMIVSLQNSDKHNFTIDFTTGKKLRLK